jgi:hypothetical protein
MKDVVALFVQGGTTDFHEAHVVGARLAAQLAQPGRIELVRKRSGRRLLVEMLHGRVIGQFHDVLRS